MVTMADDKNNIPVDGADKPDSTDKPKRHGGPVWRTKHSKKGTIARPGTSKRGPRWIKIRKRQQQVLNLRVQGLSYETIGKRVGIHKSQVERDVIACMEAMIKEPAERAFKIEMRRLDELLAGHYEAACAGDVNATYACLRVVELRARLMGWDKAEATARLMINDGASRSLAVEFILPGSRITDLSTMDHQHQQHQQHQHHQQDHVHQTNKHDVLELSANKPSSGVPIMPRKTGGTEWMG